ncbi:MAG: hypothetical protein ACK4WB_01625 [Desulfatiglandales bacterium]
MRHKVIFSILFWIFFQCLGLALAEDIKDLKKRLAETEAMVGIFTENLANCAEELEACEKKSRIVTEAKKEMITRLKELLGTEEEVEYLLKLSESELERLLTLISKNSTQKRN